MSGGTAICVVDDEGEVAARRDGRARCRYGSESVEPMAARRPGRVGAAHRSRITS